MGSHDLFDWTNFWIGFLGLWVTFGAFFQARGAKEAARQAGKNVRRHVAEVDFGTLTRLAKELHGYVEVGMMHEARLRTTDLRSELAVAILRHEIFLGPHADRLREKQIDLKLVTDGLNRNPGSLSVTEKVRLLGITGAILEVLASQCGALQSSVEMEVSNG